MYVCLLGGTALAEGEEKTNGDLSRTYMARPTRFGKSLIPRLRELTPRQAERSRNPGIEPFQKPCTWCRTWDGKASDPSLNDPWSLVANKQFHDSDSQLYMVYSFGKGQASSSRKMLRFPNCAVMLHTC